MFVIYVYVPNADLTGWELPYVCQPSLGEVNVNAFYDRESANSCARQLRQTFPGHLFAVRHVYSPALIARPS